MQAKSDIVRHGRYVGKKLLVLGSSTGATDIVMHAQREGALVYVADNLPVEESPAKAVADLPVMLSTADVEGLTEFVQKEEIDGVVSGVSGFNLVSAMRVSERTGHRYYFDQAQWNAIETKHGFRDLCERFSVPCPRTYYVGQSIDSIPWDALSYPVIVKPVDSGASQGVYVCGSRQELELRMPESVKASPLRTAIVEEFCMGQEFTAHYVILNDKAHLVCMDNRYPVAVHEGMVTTIPAARVYPSLFLDEYTLLVNPAMTSLLSSIGLECAVAFVQGLYDESTGRFSIFEAGMRSAAECPNRFLGKVTGNDYMHMLVDYVLLGHSDYDGSRDDPSLSGHCCGIVSFVARGATVGTIQGLEDAVAATPSVLQYESRYPEGSRTPDGDTLRQLMIRFVMDCDSREQMARDIRYLNEHVEVLDDEGENMVIKFDPDRLFGVR